jgi:TRAP-type C4-dicarboxylate transport system substrate-binding protein
MNDNIKAGSDIHAGDGGYSIGTQEKYDEFVKGRNESLVRMRMEDLMYKAGLTAQGCWDEMDSYDRQAIEKFAELIVKECSQQAHDLADMLSMHRDKSGAEIAESIGNTIKEHFGVKS